MTATPSQETMAQSPGTPCYFGNWIGYAPPFQPHDLMEYQEAEASRAFVAFVFDEQGRAVSFDKWLATASERDPSTLTGRALPAGKLFFAPDAADGARPGRLVSLDDTREMTEYFRARVHPDGEAATLEHVRRERMIHHEYRYWEDGQLREFRFHAGGERGVDEFDRQGNRVSSLTERMDG